MARACISPPALLVLILAFCAQDGCGHRAMRTGHRADTATPTLTRAGEFARGSAAAVGANASAGKEAMGQEKKAGALAQMQIGPPAVLPRWQAWRSQVSNVWNHVIAGLSLAAVVKVACMVGNLLVQVSPISQVQDWQAKGSTGNAEAAPFVSMSLGGSQWCTYGVAAWMLSGNDGFLVLVYANFLGAVLGCYYTFVFWRHCRNTGASSSLRQFLVAAACLVSTQTCMWFTLPHSQALIVHSCIAGGCSFVMAASLLTGLPAVFATGDTSGICGPLILANFFGAFLWAYWGWLMADPVIISANLFAAFSSSICLYVKFLYEAGKPRADSGIEKMGQGWSKGYIAATKGCHWPEEEAAPSR